VFERPVQHVRDGLEATVRMPRGALCLSRSVLEGAHVVEQQERVGEGQVHAGERTPDHEALALELPVGGHDPADVPPVGGRLGQRSQPGEGQRFGGHGGHGIGLLERRCTVNNH
jgi:hypothetical protein